MPFVIPPLVKWALVTAGAVVAVHWVVKEARRINEELDRARRVKVKASVGERRPTLRRDPLSGEYRL